MNIKINDNNDHFKFRVAGLIIHNDKFLTCQIMHNGAYALPGGHSEINEKTIDTIKREIKEEVGIDVEVVKLKSVIENFFTRKNGDKYHELCFVYELKPIDHLPQEKTIDWNIIETDEDGEKLLEFKWIDISDFNGLNVKPVAIRQILDNPNFQHFIVDEDTVTRI